MDIDLEIAADFVEAADGMGLIWSDPAPMWWDNDGRRELARPMVFALGTGCYEVGYSTETGIGRFRGHEIDNLTTAKFEARRFARFMLVA